jgi:uncharacterized protein YbjT (DUF2867 family)
LLQQNPNTMKLTLTGSIGNIGKPLVKNLVEKQHDVTVISNSPNKVDEIKSLGAIPIFGKLEDADFLTNAFANADAVYVMEPPVDFFDHNLDIPSYYSKLGHNFVNAIVNSGVQRVVHLSSIGAHMQKGSGILIFHHLVEQLLQTLPTTISITHIRPLSFYYNLLGFVAAIKKTGKITANYGGNDLITWVSPLDIADVIAEELTGPATGRSVRYVASDAHTCTETARILGAAIGKPDLKWEIIPDEQMQERLISIGMAPHLAEGLVEMNAAMHNGKLFEDFELHKPDVYGKVKMADYAEQFAKAFKS